MRVMRLKPVVLGLSVAVALTGGGIVAAADEQHGGGHPGPSRGGGHPGGPGGRPGFRGGPGGYRAGPGFRGGGIRAARFHGRDFAHFSPADRALWTGGAWHQGWHGGRFGWWWGVGGAWFLYPAPIYPYPQYVADTYFDDPGAGYDPGYDQDMGGAQPMAGAQPGGAGYWYYCQASNAYYPYVQSCAVPWTPVPPSGPSQ